MRPSKQPSLAQGGCGGPLGPPALISAGWILQFDFSHPSEATRASCVAVHAPNHGTFSWEEDSKWLSRGRLGERGKLERRIPSSSRPLLRPVPSPLGCWNAHPSRASCLPNLAGRSPHAAPWRRCVATHLDPLAPSVDHGVPDAGVTASKPSNVSEPNRLLGSV